MREKKLKCSGRIIFVLFMFFLFSSALSMAQEKRISLDLNNVTVKEALEQIKAKTSYSLWFNANDVDLTKKVTAVLADKTISQALDIILEGQLLDYEVKEKLIRIFKKVDKKEIEKKDKIITGVVVDDVGEVLPGVSIRIKEDTSLGTVTDLDGKFSLALPPNAKNIIVSYVGMKTSEEKIKSGSMKIVLTSDSQILEEVVVTGYQKIDRRLFTGAAERITGDEIKVDGVADVSKMLQGKAAGVQVQTVSGTFGAAPKIRVRGASSINGNQTPLWVVDGVVLEDVVEISADDLSSGNASTLISSAIAGINPDDIESFQILRDASATALYGARAMNGVVVVVTKKGKKGAARIGYTGEFTMRTRPNYSQYNIMNSKEQMEVYLDMEKKGWLNNADMARASNGGVFFRMYDQINYYDSSSGKFGIPNTVSARLKYLQEAEMRNTDWFKELFRLTLQNNHSLSISSGNERSRYYASISYFNDPGWTKSDKVNRYTINMNTSYDITPKITLGFATTGSIREQRVPGTNDRSSDVVNGEYTRDFDINPFSYALNTSRTMEARDGEDNLTYYQMNYAPFNILNEQENNYLDLKMMDIKLQLELNYKVVKGLELSALGAVRYVKSSQEHKIWETSNLAMAYRAAEDATIRENNKYLYKDPDDPEALPQVVMPKGGFYNVEDNALLNYYQRATANYSNAFNDKHILNVLVGEEIKYADRQKRYNYGYGYEWSRGGIPNIDYRILKQMLEGNFFYYGMDENFDRFAAFFATGSYSYDGIYTFNATGRYDGSNRLGRAKSSRWLPTWNVSGAWNVHREKFMQSQDVISTLSVRATYGLTASMGPANNALAIYKNELTFRPSLDKESATVIKSLENSELTWEKQYETNIGFELGLLKNRISLSFDGYVRKGFDLIGLSYNPGIGGEGLKYSNYADMKSRGFEFTLNTRNIQQKGFSWTSNLTFSYNRNEITSLESRTGVFDLIKAEGGPLQGYPVRSLFSLQFQGLDEYGIPTFINKDGGITSTGINFQERESLAHLKYEGPIDPKVTGGFDNSLTYKNWKMNIFFTYQFGNVIRLNPDFSASYSDISAMPKELKNRWMQPGDEFYTSVPAIPSMRQYTNISNLARAYNAYNYSDVRVADGSFIRLKEVSLSYDFKQDWMKSIGMTSLQLRAVASNLWLIYADKKLNGQDPEFFRAGGVAMPTPRQFTLSVRTSF